MKKIRNVVLILTLILCFIGCEKNPVEVATSSSNDELTVDQAKAFVETQRMNEFTLKSGKSERKRINIRSDWNKSERSNNGDISVVETQIEAMGQFGFATPDCMEAWNTSKNDAYLYSMSRLVVIKNKKSGEMYSFIMSVVGDKHYLEGKKFKMWDNTYLKRDKDLSGFVLFHDLSGAFVNGWIYCDGQITNSIIKPIDLDLTINLKSAMVLLTIYDWVKECSDWQNNYVASDGTATVVAKRCTERLVVVGYYETGGGVNEGETTGGGSTPGSYNPPIQPCNCLDRCPTCGKCIGNTLKSAIVPGGGTTTTTPTTDPCESCTGHPVPVIELTDKFENNVKVMCVYSKLIQTAARSFNPLVNSFLANFSDGTTINPGDITFDLGSLDGAHGTCTQAGDDFTIVLNENTISERSSIEMARSMMHEILHAQIGHSLEISIGSFVSNFGQYTSTIQGKLYTDQHLLMMENYVQPMANFLKNFDNLNGYSADDSYYKGLALCGLKDLISLSSSEFDEIIRAQDYFRNRGLNCQ